MKTYGFDNDPLNDLRAVVVEYVYLYTCESCPTTVGRRHLCSFWGALSLALEEVQLPIFPNFKGLGLQRHNSGR